MAKARGTARDEGQIAGGESLPGEQARRAMPARPRLRSVTGTSASTATSVLEAGAGLPVVLLHGPMGNASHWMRVIPELAETRRVIVPDLPGHGASEAGGPDQLDVARVLKWLAELIAQTCERPPVLVGQTLGGAIAASFAGEKSDMLTGLVLVDTLGLRPFEPEPEFGRALSHFLAQPDERTHTDLWRHCAFDLDSLRQRMGDRWRSFEAYNLDRAREPGARESAGKMMELFGMPAIVSKDLASISVPTSLIWGRHDKATPLSVAEHASVRFGWPLHVIEDCNDDPPIEQPEALLRALELALGRP